MTSSSDTPSMALFCDFENVALGVRDANLEKFDIKLVLERLLLKGSIVVKKAYCDWERYKGFKAAMHEANFELIEIPHVRQSGKNSADIRLVVDALDLCYTKSHVNTFVIISGDSDFSPLVSKLRENAKQVIGVGVKQSTSDLLIANCDEFIFYDDLARENQRATAKRAKETQPAPKRSADEEKRRRDDLESRRSEAIEIAVQTFDALVTERGDSGKVWASALKDAIKRRKPDFSESYYGFRAFGNLLEEAQTRGLFEVGRDEKSGTFVFRGNGGAVRSEPAAPRESRSKRGARRKGAQEPAAAAIAELELPVAHDLFTAPEVHDVPAVTEYAEARAEDETAPVEPAARRKGRGSRKTSSKKAEAASAVEAPPPAGTAPDQPAPAAEAQPAQPEERAPKAKKTARKTAPRVRRPRKADAATE
ncbi:MAG: NYN domain-containing protein [Paraburkholderia sp.]|uniref:NYN domain-containing protein n=1 Tax=Paraburkholderia sp. TaxID=1926495 RepID=UPI00120A16EE|nr:NYN domain-containing protein [Paraburkholderia sp.]TAL96958.1 MAG: NYN domain-containing protein [Paraburkholderia sp.]